MAMQAQRGVSKWAAGLLIAAIISACAPLPVPQPIAVLAPPVIAKAPSADSMAVSAYYNGVQQSLLSRGLLRTDGGGPDTPLTATMLTNNFLRIAFYEEYPSSSGTTISPIRLTRWTKPLKVALFFGASVNEARSRTDRARIASYLARLSRLTGLSIGLTDGPANVTIAMTDVDERASLGPMIARSLPQISAAQVASVTNMDRSIYCLVWTQSNSSSGKYDSAFVYVPAEHPDLMRLACIHEEIAQALGLPNDVATARPSIFNDDEEFALLTRQDELLLRMLYDPALKAGMTENEARPIVQALAERLLGGNS
jgi:hypothetical protein